MTDPRHTERKPTASNPYGNCAQVAVIPRTNVTLAAAAAAERAHARHLIRVRNDTPGLGGPPLLFTPPEWEAFTAAVKAGEFDLDGDGFLPPVPGEPAPVAVTVERAGGDIATGPVGARR